MNYKQQLEVVQGLFVPPDTSMRMDCPFCNGKNTLSVDTMNNGINWYCFHASCSAKGKYQVNELTNHNLLIIEILIILSVSPLLQFELKAGHLSDVVFNFIPYLP